MGSERLYTQQEVMGVISIENQYRTFIELCRVGSEDVLHRPMIITHEHEKSQAKQIIRQMQQYPGIFEDKVKFLQERLKDYGSRHPKPSKTGSGVEI